MDRRTTLQGLTITRSSMNVTARMVNGRRRHSCAPPPCAPPPGLVTVPTESLALSGVDTMSGYRNAGDRAIRVDMLERLLHFLRNRKDHEF